MKPIYTSYLLAGVFLLSSCFSSVSVRVHSLDMSKMREMPEYRSVRQEQELSTYNTLLQGGYFDSLMNRIYRQVKDSLSADSTFAPADIAYTMDTVARPRLEVIIGDFKNTMTNVRNALSNYTRSPLPALKRTYDTAFSKYALQLETVGASLRELAFEIKEGDKDAVPFGFALTTNYDKLNNEHGVSSTFGISIADDAMASFVAKAPEQFWQKYKASFYDSGTNLTKSSKKANANVTRIVTFIGNSDIAVKMDGPANFVIKGVRLDADAAFRTSFKVLSQGIKYLTDVAGSPISPASGNSGTPAATIPELANLQKNKGQSESLDLALQNSTDALLRIIAANRADALSPNATRRKNAINAIRNAYTFYKTQLPTQ